jgi:hypothetical protein
VRRHAHAYPEPLSAGHLHPGPPPAQLRPEQHRSEQHWPEQHRSEQPRALALTAQRQHLNAATLLHLQRHAGNAAVTRLLAVQRAPGGGESATMQAPVAPPVVHQPIVPADLNSLGPTPIPAIPLQQNVVQPPAAPATAAPAAAQQTWGAWAWGKAASAYEGAGTLATTAGRGISSAATTAGRGISNAASSAYEGAGELATSAGRGLNSAATAAGRGISSAATTAGRGISNTASSAYEGASNLASSAYEGAGNLATAAGRGISNTASSAFEGASELAASAGRGINSAATSAGRGISSAATSAGRGISGAATAVGEHFDGDRAKMFGALGASAVPGLQINAISQGGAAAATGSTFIAAGTGVASASAVGDALSELAKFPEQYKKHGSVLTALGHINMFKVLGGVASAGGLVMNTVGQVTKLDGVRYAGMGLQAAGLGLKATGEGVKWEEAIGENGVYKAFKDIPAGDYSKAVGNFVAVAGPVLQAVALAIQRDLEAKQGAAPGSLRANPAAVAAAFLAGGSSAGDAASELMRAFTKKEMNVPKFVAGLLGTVGAITLGASAATANPVGMAAGYGLQQAALAAKAYGEGRKVENEPWGKLANWPLIGGYMTTPATAPAEPPIELPDRGATA